MLKSISEIKAIKKELDFLEKIKVQKEKNSPAKLVNAAYDWWRSKDSYYVNGKLFNTILEKKIAEDEILKAKLVEQLKNGAQKSAALWKIFNENDYQVLVDIWQEEFGNSYIEILSQHAHQGSVPHALKSAIIEAQQENNSSKENKDYLIKSSNADSTVYFVLNKANKQIEITERVNVDAIYDPMSMEKPLYQSNPEKEKVNGQRKPFSAPILQGVCKSVITSNTITILEFDIKLRPENILLNNNSLSSTMVNKQQLEQLANVYNKENILKRVINFFKSIFKEVIDAFSSEGPKDDVEERMSAFNSRKM